MGSRSSASTFAPLTVDPREKEDWFQLLDPDAQDVVRNRWVTQDAQWESYTVRSRFSPGRTMFEGWLILFCVQLVVCSVLGGFLKHFTGGMTVAILLQNLAWASVAGVLLGVFWAVAESGELTITVTAAVVCTALQLTLVNSGLMAAPALFGAPILAGGAARMIGLQRYAPLN
tara:strand:+ start:13854 stop:14372 length:519 start_codon:yes stop_codon:yes gene_type:complete